MRKILVCFLLYSSTLFTAYAQVATYEVKGRIFDAETGQPLFGATVAVQGTTLGTTSDENGRYRIQRLPEGEHKLICSYIGFETAVQTIIVSENSQLQEDFRLTGSQELLDAVEVRSAQRGQARSFNQQKEAVSVVNIISIEQIERFPDLNVTEAIKRVPGVAVETDRGEAADVYIRGMAPNLHNVRINGQRVASTEGDNRATGTNIIPADMLSSLEVSKTISADMDADAVSGSINIVTRRPTGDGPMVLGRLTGGYHNLSQQPNIQAALSYGNRKGKLDYAIGGTYQYDSRATHDIRHDFAFPEFNGVPTDVLAGLRPSSYETINQRIGFFGQVDYTANENTSLYFRAIGNYYSNYEVRKDARLGINNGEYVSPDTAVGARFERAFREYERRTNLLSLNAGGKSNAGALTLDYNVGYSVGTFHTPIRDYFTFRHADKPTYVSDISDRNFGQVEVVNDNDIYNTPELMNLRYYEEERERSTDNTVNASFNGSIPYSLGDHKGLIKTGARYLGFFKDRSYNENRYTPTDIAITQQDFVVMSDERFVEGRYQMGPDIDFGQGRTIFNNNRDAFELDENRSRENSDPNNFTADEHILAAYALTDLTIGNLNINAGVRAEQTFNSYNGFRVEFDENEDYQQTVEQNGSNRYFNLFPMVNLRYEITPRTNIRAAYTQTIARPSFADLVPYELVNRGGGTLSIDRGNPNLSPSTSTNYDLLGEHYFRNIGILSGGVFYKNLNEFIYQESELITEGEFSGFTLNQPRNGEDAQLYGLEVAWQQNLTFLPGFLSGFGIYANYSYIRSEALIIVPEARRIPLPRQAPHILNLALSYEHSGFVAQLSYNFRDTWLHSVGGSTSAPALQERGEEYLDRYFNRVSQLDLALSQRLGRNTQVMLNLYNLTNQSHLHYFGTPDYPYRNSFFSWWGNIGFRYVLN